jgi:hypothetical protein
MKTKFYLKHFLLAIMAVVFAISCTKVDTNPPVLATVTPDPGAIVDFGVLGDGARMMQVTLNTQNFSLEGGDLSSVVSGNFSQLMVVFYVDADGAIPDGNYVFSSSDTKVPFTFDSAVLLSASSEIPYIAYTDQFVNGQINVEKTEDHYSFTVQCDLSQGLKYSGNYNGPMNYTDYSVK